MKLLEPIPFRKTEQRFTVDDWLGLLTYSFGGNSYTLPLNTTYGANKVEPIPTGFPGLVSGALYNDSVVFGLERKRLEVFSQGRFQFQQFQAGRPGKLFGDQSLGVLERPWPGGTTGDLLASMLLDADFAGNAYYTRQGNEVIRLRPDWVEIVLGDRPSRVSGREGFVGYEKLGYFYFHGGKGQGHDPIAFEADEVAHFAPTPDPLAFYRGMSWLTPVVREIEADIAATTHKLKFFENAATPNLAVSLKEVTDPVLFEAFIEKMEEQHAGLGNAYKTLYLGAGADVTVVGADMRQLDFKVVQGAGETRIALAAGVPPVVASLSEGMQGSSLNAGNYAQARRQFADTTIAHLWQNVAGSLEVLVPPPSASQLKVDTRDVPFLQEDRKDDAEIHQKNASTIRQLVDAGFDPDSVVDAVTTGDYALLSGQHSGLYSVQLQPPGAKEPEADATTLAPGVDN